MVWPSSAGQVASSLNLQQQQHVGQHYRNYLSRRSEQRVCFHTHAPCDLFAFTSEIKDRDSRLGSFVLSAYVHDLGSFATVLSASVHDLDPLPLCCLHLFTITVHSPTIYSHLQRQKYGKACKLTARATKSTPISIAAVDPRSSQVYWVPPVPVGEHCLEVNCAAL